MKMEENSFNCLDSQKGFNLQNIRDLLNGKKEEDYKLITRFYTELVLLSEVIESPYKNINHQEISFSFREKEKIPYDILTFFKFDDNQIKIISGEKDFFYKEKSVDNKLYYSTRNKWYVDIDKSMYKSFHIDKLYFNGVLKRAKNIQIISEGKPYKEKNIKSPSTEKEREKIKKPIGVKYIYQEVNQDTIIFFPDSKGNIIGVRDLKEDEKKILKLKQYSQNSKIICHESNNERIDEKFLEEHFQETKLVSDIIWYKGKELKIPSQRIFYSKEIKPSKPSCYGKENEHILFSAEKKIYTFKETILFESTNSNTKSIALKEKENNENFSFEKQIAEVFDSNHYQKLSYDVKLIKYQPPINNNYTILVEKKPLLIKPKKNLFFKDVNYQWIEFNKKFNIENTYNYNEQYTVEDIYQKYQLSIGDIAVSIFIKDNELKNIPFNDNTILMTDPTTNKEFKCNYLKILYRLRNSIAHGQFKILEDKIIFCNEFSKKINLRAKIFKKDIDSFLKELRVNTLDVQLTEHSLITERLKYLDTDLIEEVLPSKKNELLDKYIVYFIKHSKEDWEKINSKNKNEFKKELKKQLEDFNTLNNKLDGYTNIYKIELSSLTRLLYQIKENKIIIVRIK